MRCVQLLVAGLLLVLAIASAEATEVKVNGHQVTYHTGRWNGDRKSLFRVSGKPVHEPNYAVSVKGCSGVKRSADSNGFSFRVAVVPTDPRDLGLPKGVKQMRVDRVSMRLRGRPHSAFQRTGVTVTCYPDSASKSDRARRHWLQFRCPSRSLCDRMRASLRYHSKGAGLEPTISELEFVLHGSAHGRQIQVLKPWLPVIGRIRRPFSRHFWFEGDKLLLFAIKANVGVKAYDAFVAVHQHYPKPSSGSQLPKIYRSQLLNNLPQVLARKNGKWEMVAEMRVGERRVAQVVFDVSFDTQRLSMTNWFSPHRAKFSYPYWIGRTGFNYFSVRGHIRNDLQRSFFINSYYGGCAGDRGFWMVNDIRDPCPYSNQHWRGRPPSLVYIQASAPYQYTNARADSFLIYLRQLK